jgi:hypothetical protein
MELVQELNLPLADIIALLQNIKDDTGNILQQIVQTRQDIANFKDAVIASNVQNKNEIIAAINGLQINPATGTVDLSAIEGMLAQLLTLVGQGNNTLTDIDAKMDLLNMTVNAMRTILQGMNIPNYESILEQILAALGGNSYDDSQVLAMLQAILDAIMNCCNTCYDDASGHNEGSGGDGEIGGELYCVGPQPNATGSNQFPRTAEGTAEAIQYILDHPEEIQGHPATGGTTGGGQVGIGEVIQNAVQQEFDLQSFNQAEFIIYDVMGRAVRTFKGSQVNNPAAMNTDLKYQTTTQVIKGGNDSLSAGTLKSSGLFDGLPNGKYHVKHIVK